MSLVLVCPPVIVVEKRVPIVTVKTCRLSKIYPSDNNVYQVEILEAPPVEIELEEDEDEEEDVMINFVSSQTQRRPYHS
jgi:hypothetical protein